MDYLATLGIVANRMSTISYGEEIPVCKESTEAFGRAIVAQGLLSRPENRHLDRRIIIDCFTCRPVSNRHGPVCFGSLAVF